jgi:hypothetical protein
MLGRFAAALLPIVTSLRMPVYSIASLFALCLQLTTSLRMLDLF